MLEGEFTDVLDRHVGRRPQSLAARCLYLRIPVHRNQLSRQLSVEGCERRLRAFALEVNAVLQANHPQLLRAEIVDDGQPELDTIVIGGQAFNF